MRQPTDRQLVMELPTDSSLSSLVRRLALTSLLLVGLTVLASFALAGQF